MDLITPEAQLICSPGALAGSVVYQRKKPANGITKVMANLKVLQHAFIASVKCGLLVMSFRTYIAHDERTQAYIHHA